MDGKEYSEGGANRETLMTSPPPLLEKQQTPTGLTPAQKARWDNQKHQWVKVTDPTNHLNTTMLERQYILSPEKPDGTSGATGKKSDQGKSRVDLLDPEFLLSVGDVLRFGSEKYAAHNWRGGIHVSRLLGAILRHTLAICRGEDIDSESGLPHSAHLGCTVMFLHWMLIHRKDLDDRWKY